MVKDDELEERLNSLGRQRWVDDQPSVEGPSLLLSCDPSFKFNYQDRNAFDTHWVDETVTMEKLVRITNIQINYINCIYLALAAGGDTEIG